MVGDISTGGFSILICKMQMKLREKAQSSALCAKSINAVRQ